MLNGKSTLYSMFETDPQIEQDGIELVIGPCKFIVRRAGGSNRRFAAVVQRLIKPLARGNPSEEVAAEAMMRAYGEAVVIGWEGVTDREGNALPYSVQNFVQVMRDLPDVFTIIREESDKLANFRKVSLEAEGEELGKH